MVDLYNVFVTQHVWFLIDIFVDYGVFLCLSLGCYITLMSGQISIGHGGLASVGAYLTAVLTVNFGASVWLSIPLAGLAGAAAGLVIAYMMALRLEGMYLAIGTFAFGEGLAVFWQNTDYVGGALGFVRVPQVTDLGLILIVLGIISFFLWRFEKSHLGRAFRATFDDEWTAMAMGVNIDRVKIYAWVLGGFITGIGGALYAHNLTVVRPNNFIFDYAVLILLAPCLGGYYTYWGTYIGAGIIQFAPWILNVTEPLNKRIFYSTLYVIIMVWRPEGIVGRQGVGMPLVLRKLFKQKSIDEMRHDREIVATWADRSRARRQTE